MPFNFRAFLMSAFALSCLMPATAQDATVPAEHDTASADQMMTNWLMVDMMDRNCRILGFTDRLALTREMAAQTRIWRANHGETSPDDLLNALSDLTDTAMTNADSVGCEDAMNYIYQARREYMQSVLALIVSAAGNDVWDAEPDAIKASWQALVNEIGNFFGPDDFNALRANFQESMQGIEIDKTDRWRQLRPLLFAVHWQLSLNEDGYAVFPDDQQRGQFSYVIHNSETDEDLPYSISPPAEISVTDEDGTAYRMLSSTGQTDEDQIAVFLLKYDGAQPPNELNASLLVQQQARAGSAASLQTFEAETLSEDECPTSFCFVFPAEATPEDDAEAGRTVQLVFSVPEAE